MATARGRTSFLPTNILRDRAKSSPPTPKKLIEKHAERGATSAKPRRAPKHVSGVHL